MAPKINSVVVFDPSTFNPDFWNNLPENDRCRYYGPLGYGTEKPKHFVYLGDIVTAPGHCILVDMDNDKVLTMRHTENFRELTDEEF